MNNTEDAQQIGSAASLASELHNLFAFSKQFVQSPVKPSTSSSTTCLDLL